MITAIVMKTITSDRIRADRHSGIMVTSCSEGRYVKYIYVFSKSVKFLISDGGFPFTNTV